MKKKFDTDFWLEQSESPKAQRAVTAAPAPSGSLAEDVRIVVERIVAERIDITGDYATWLKVCFALIAALGEYARVYFHAVSQFYPGYSHEEADKQFDNCLKAKGHGINPASFFEIARQHGIDIVTGTSISRDSATSAPAEDAETTESAESKRERPLIEAPTFYDKVRGHMPDFLERIAALMDTIKDADIIILAVLGVVSACLPNVYGKYGRVKVFPNLFYFLTARASSGKGQISLCRYIIQQIHDELRETYEAKKAAYEQDMQEYERNWRKKPMEKPKKPAQLMLIIPGNSTATSVYQILNDNNGVAVMIETEGDTFSNSFGSDHGDWSVGFRNAFHHEPISYHRRGGDEHAEVKEPRLSVVLSGTPEQVRTLIKTPENGLFSRFVFYFLESELTWKDCLDESEEDSLNDQFAAFGKEFHEFYEILKTSTPRRFRVTTEQHDRFNQFFEENQKNLYNMFGNDIIASIRRLGLICFRIAMIFTVLRGMETGDCYSPLLCSDEDFDNALAITEVLIQHTSKVYCELFERRSGYNPQKNVIQAFLDALPQEFSRQDYMKAALAVGLSDRTGENYILKFAQEGKVIERLSQGKYRKINNPKNK